MDGRSDWCGFEWLIASCQSYSERSILHPEFGNMADLEDFDSALEKALSALSGLGISLKLRSEQKQAVRTLLLRRDLLAILPTGFGKSLIFQLLVQVKEILTGKPACVIVVCPLKSIVYDQLSEATAMGLTATSLSDASLEDVENGKYQLIFGSAEEILEKPFLGRLKKSSSPLCGCCFLIQAI